MKGEIEVNVDKTNELIKIRLGYATKVISIKELEYMIVHNFKKQTILPEFEKVDVQTVELIDVVRKGYIQTDKDLKAGQIAEGTFIQRMPLDFAKLEALAEKCEINNNGAIRVLDLSKLTKEEIDETFKVSLNHVTENNLKYLSVAYYDDKLSDKIKSKITK